MANLLHAIELAYQKKQHQPAITATILAEQMLVDTSIAPDDPQYETERERFRQAAGDWLRQKFDPLLARR